MTLQGVCRKRVDRQGPIGPEALSVQRLVDRMNNTVESNNRSLKRPVAVWSLMGVYREHQRPRQKEILDSVIHHPLKPQYAQNSMETIQLDSDSELDASIALDETNSEVSDDEGLYVSSSEGEEETDPEAE